LASTSAAFGNIGAASAASAGLSAADLVSQIMQRTKMGNIAQSRSDIQDALGLLSMGQNSQAEAKIGAQPGTLIDPEYKNLASQLYMSIYGAPKDLGQGVARQLFPTQAPVSGPLAQVFDRIRGTSSAMPTSQTAAPTSTTGAPLAPSPMGSQVTEGGPTSSMTALQTAPQPPSGMIVPGSSEATSIAMDILTGKHKTPYEATMERMIPKYFSGQLTDPAHQEMVRRYLMNEKEPTDALNMAATHFLTGSDTSGRGKESFDALIAAKKVPLQRLTDMEERLKLLGDKLDFARQQYQETGKPKATAETKKIQADTAVDFEKGLAEIRKEAPKSSDLLIMNAADKASAKASQRLKIKNYFDRAISAEPNPAQKKVLEKQRDEEMKQYAPSGGLTSGKFNLGF
jgi:hypothetical protein